MQMQLKATKGKRLGIQPWIYGIAMVTGTTILFPQESQAAVLYNDLYNHFNPDSSLVKDGQNPPDDVASWAYFANQADSFGGVIGFDASSNRLDSFSVIMSNWYGWDPDGGVGIETPSYETNLTLKLYEVDRSGDAPAPGAPITQDTESHEIAGRQLPTDSNASFADRGGTDSLVDWDLDGVRVGKEILFMVQVDALVGAISENPPSNEALQSLNIAAAATGNNPDVTAGVDTDEGVYWRSDANTDGDISRFVAGQVLAQASGSAVDIPEPSAIFGLSAIGLSWLAWRRRFEEHV